MSTDDQERSDVTETTEESQSTSTETSLESDTEANEANVDQGEQQETESASASGVSDYAAGMVDKVSTMNEDQRLAQIQKLERSGRARDKEALGMLYEMYDMEPMNAVSNDDIDKAVEQKLQAMGINPDKISELQYEREKTKRQSYVEKQLKSLGVNKDAQDIMTTKEFVMAYNDPRYATLSLEEKADLALRKAVNVTKPAKSPTGGTPGVGKPTAKAPKSDDDNPIMAAWKKQQW